MKNLIYILLLAIVSFTACKKEPTPAPAPQAQAPNNPNNPTSVDTTGKFKIYFRVNLACVTTASDYINGTSNMRVFHNADTIKLTDLYCHNLYDTTYNTGIDEIVNYNEWGYFPSVTPKPVWMALGDSLVFEMDRVEYANGMVTGALQENFYVFDANKGFASLSSHINNVVTMSPIQNIGTDTYLGTGHNISNGQNLPNCVYLSGKTRITFVLPMNYH